jgi:hypothetical protein
MRFVESETKSDVLAVTLLALIEDVTIWRELRILVWIVEARIELVKKAIVERLFGMVAMPPPPTAPKAVEKDEMA